MTGPADVHDAFDLVEEKFNEALDESLDPAGPGVLYDYVAGMGLAAGAIALDAGCGEGEHAIELSRRFGLRVTGIDPVAHLPHDRQAQRPRLPGVSAWLAGREPLLMIADRYTPYRGGFQI
jgi:hypothetical protein